MERLRIVGLADTDSYVKWGASLLGSVADAADVSMLIVETPVVVSESQQRAALAGSGLGERVRRVEYAALAEELARIRPDAVLIAARGPLARVLARLIAGLSPRPVIVTGLPGISIPATTRALQFRAQCDLFVLHSTREVREFAALAASRGLSQRFGLSRLPFAQPARGRLPGSDVERNDLVFAAQAIVPRERADRVRIARLLVAAARADPSRRVVVKLRAAAGEKQTHRELDDYRDLLARMARREPLPENLVVSTVPMARALDTAAGLVTVSSTAAVEAIARGVPVVVLDTFGVSDQLINPVFLGSGLLAGEAAVVTRDFRHPRAEWLADNYFHDPAMDAWFDRLRSLVEQRRAARLAPKPPLARRGGRARDLYERRLALGRNDRSLAGIAIMAVGWPVRLSLRAWNRLRRLGTGPVPVRVYDAQLWAAPSDRPEPSGVPIG